MLNLEDLIHSVKDENYMTVRKELVTYGSIIRDNSFECLSGPQQGSHRITHFLYKNVKWVVQMHNGEVTEVYYKPIE